MERPFQCEQMPQGGREPVVLKSHQEQPSRRRRLFDRTWPRSLPTEGQSRLHSILEAGIRSWLACSRGAEIPLATRGIANLCAPAKNWGMLHGDLQLGWNKCRESRAKSQFLGRTEMENKAKSCPAEAMTWWCWPEWPKSSMWKQVRD